MLLENSMLWSVVKPGGGVTTTTTNNNTYLQYSIVQYIPPAGRTPVTGTNQWNEWNEMKWNEKWCWNFCYPSQNPKPKLKTPNPLGILPTLHISITERPPNKPNNQHKTIKKKRNYKYIKRLSWLLHHAAGGRKAKLHMTMLLLYYYYTTIFNIPDLAFAKKV